MYAVNKMDLVDYSEERFDEIARELADLTSRLGVHDETAIPISALKGDNVVERDRRDAVVRRARRCSSTSRPSSWPTTATTTTAASPCSG